MALGIENISTDLVGTTLGTSSRDVGTLCKHSAVNKWSKWKPVHFDTVTGITLEDLISINCGFQIDSQIGIDNLDKLSSWIYFPPMGGVSSPFRLGDFRGYNHSAPIPFELTMRNNVNGTNLLVLQPSDLGYSSSSYEVRLRYAVGRDI